MNQKLESMFSKVIAGNQAQHLLDTGKYSAGAVHALGHAMPISITNGTNTVTIHVRYKHKNPTVFYPTGTTTNSWEIKHKEYELNGTYSVNVTERSHYKQNHTPTRMPSVLITNNGEHRRTNAGTETHFGEHPQNVFLRALPEKEVEEDLVGLVLVADHVRNKEILEYMSEWCERTLSEVTVPYHLQNVMSDEFTRRQINKRLQEALEMFTSNNPPGTSWDRWCDLYIKRGVDRSHRWASSDVTTIEYFMKRYPDINDPVELQKEWEKQEAPLFRLINQNVFVRALTL